MISYSNVDLGVEALESLRIPFENKSCQLDWKDWYHYILFDPGSGTKILMNVSLGGRPGDGEVQVSLVIKHARGRGKIETYAEVRSVPWEPGMVKRFPLEITTPNVKLQIKDGQSGLVMNGRNSDIHLEFTAEARGDPFLIDEQAKFGQGYIGWGFIPGMAVKGFYSVCGTNFKIGGSWYCYHDRNFGRFRWGEDIGWEWIVASFEGSNNSSYQVVFDQRTNKDHSEKGFQYIFIFRDNRLKKVFVGNTLRVKWKRKKPCGIPLRLPGNMASAFADKISAEIESVELTARDDKDFINITFHTAKAFQLIVPDYEKRQFTVMEEISGKAFLNGMLSGSNIKAKGHFYAEFVR